MTPFTINGICIAGIWHKIHSMTTRRGCLTLAFMTARDEYKSFNMLSMFGGLVRSSKVD